MKGFSLSRAYGLLPRKCVYCGKRTFQRFRSFVLSLAYPSGKDITKICHHSCYDVSRNQIISDERIKDIMKKSAAQELANPPQFPNLK